MQLTFLKTKLHRATLTAADPDYEGSISIDRALCREAGLGEFEQVDVYDITNGARFTTYVIYGEAGQIQVNGAAARLVRPGDLVIVAAYVRLEPREVQTHEVRVLLLGPDNQVKRVNHTKVQPA
jgi:aspartate 1-decarboxylase